MFIVRDYVTFTYTGSQTFFTPKGKDIIRIKYMEKQTEVTVVKAKES